VSLFVTFSGSSRRFLARDAVFSRQLGEPVSWRVRLAAVRSGYGDAEWPELANALAAGPVRATVQWEGGGSQVELGPPGLVVATEWESEERRETMLPAEAARILAVTVRVTDVQHYPGGAFRPRRRILHEKKLSGLFARFEGIARLTTALRNQLDAIAFPDGSQACIIQDGLSDWEFYQHMLQQAAMLERSEDSKALVMSGGVNDQAGTANRWVVSWGDAQAYHAHGDVAARALQKRSSGFERLELGGGAVRGARRTEFPCGVAPDVVRLRDDQTFQASEWTAWRTADLPRFIDGSTFVWRIEDRLYEADDHTLGWTSEIHSGAAMVPRLGKTGDFALRAWVGLGVVETHSDAGPWLRVRLPGFESADQGDLLDVRLATPYSGTDGKKGLHFVPEKGQHVVVASTGRFGESALLMGNHRTEAATLVSPSLYLEKDTHFRFDKNLDVIIKGEYTAHLDKSSTTEIQKNIVLTIKGTTTIDETGVMKIKADQCDVKLQGGTFYTGKGL
jgi:hypothetical protein